MSSREDENAKPVTVKIIETVYVEADTADDLSPSSRGSPARAPSPPSRSRTAGLLHRKMLRAGLAKATALVVITRRLAAPPAQGRTGEIDRCVIEHERILHALSFSRGLLLLISFLVFLYLCNS